jgi:hypothetical protein
MTMPDELLDLMRAKLSTLEKALILETDASVQFKLKHDIQNLKQQLVGREPALNSVQIPNALSKQDEIFISYAWGGESERIVNELDTRLLEKGLTVIRDKRDLGFKGKIKEFMQRIGQGHYVVVVISDKYLKSDNCMFELLEIARNGDFYDRIFPIVLADAEIYKPVKRLAYVKHWETEIQELDAAMKEVGAANLQGFRDEIDLYTKIREMIAGLTDVFKNMNTLMPEMHEASNFEQLYQALESKRSRDR